MKTWYKEEGKKEDGQHGTPAKPKLLLLLLLLLFPLLHTVKDICVCAVRIYLLYQRYWYCLFTYLYLIINVFFSPFPCTYVHISLITVRHIEYEYRTHKTLSYTHTNSNNTPSNKQAKNVDHSQILTFFFAVSHVKLEWCFCDVL